MIFGSNMWFAEEIDIKASSARVFRLYADVAGWPTWDPDVESSSIEGKFQAGATGELKPKRGPKSAITITEVVSDRSFTAESRLPFCVMRFEHELRSDAGYTKAVHRVSFEGPLAFLFGRLIGPSIRKGLPQTLRGLKQAAERQS